MSFRRQNQPGPGGRKTANGTSGSMASSVPGSNSNRPTPGRNRNSVKTPSQSPPVFEGVYNNSRMLHFLTAVVGSRCDVMVKNGSVYEGIFKTLSSRCELAVDAVHKVKNEEGDGGGGGGTPVHPRREEITDTMIFGPNDLVTMICRDVDLNYATRDTFTDSAIGSRINGDHREKVLQRWDGGDSNEENFDLDADTSNGWDASEMFRFNEETYGVKSTYDASLSMYTVPLERGSSEGFRQREARAARLANEIEASTQYRSRVSLENDEGRTEEDKYSAVIRDRDRDGGERGRDSPGFSSAGSREGKYIPLPQRAKEREMGVSGRAERGGAVSTLPNRTNRPGPSSSSPRPLASGSGQPIPPTDRISPLSVRGGYSTHQSQSSPPTQPRPSEPGHSSPPSPHTLPHSLSHPQSLSDSARPVNGVSSRMSPKSQRPGQTNRNLRTSNSHSFPTVSRSPKTDAPSQDPPLANPTYLDTSSVTMVTPKLTGPTPLFPVDVNEILSKERTESPSPASPQEGKSSKVHSVQQRSQLEELRKFSNDFILPSSSNLSSPKTATTDSAQANPAHNTQTDPAPPTEAKTAPPTTPTAELPAEDRSRETNAEGAATTTPPPATSISAPSAMQNPTAEGQTSGTPQPARTPGSEEGKPEASERSEGMADQVKKSTLNPNAKEFNPTKAPLSMVKPSATPTPPRPTPPSPTVVLQPPPGQGAIYNTPYLSYMSPIQIQGHSVQAPQMYPYSMTTVGQGKYARTKGSVVTRPDHSSSAPPMIQAAASAAGPPLVASPYPPSYLQYNQVIQAMPHYPGQMYSMLQGGPRMLGSGGHPQTLGPLGPQYPGQNEGPPAPQQGMYAPQSFSHHSGSIHHPQPSSTPTGSQPPPQHPAPSPGQSGQSGPQPLYHTGPLSAPTPPNLPPGHNSPQASYSLQGYSLPGHQPLPHPYSSLGQLTQTHVPGALSGPHHSGGHGPPPVMLLHAPPPPPQQGSGPQHGPPPPQQGPHQHFTYIGPPQVSVQAHPSQQIPFHPSGN
ncbi:ataxin-2-like protein isoform X2 [Sinocyclocheilus anshuiensis]|uniref:ataxin-2-like protein isoform X1 n=1 Tax=Sinocyclocheilus anshuiensis TaxID=1608454 RepID=UPI0007BA71C2|nr:PREDICTED: ataxin-2-like protein isoform X1 [Sinocyclocheilus anshuiensis]XP_016342453.1 PREDICTED: ataxin-2-like protein isoform X2 [Sinocyclocheilus anshuiensis]